MPAMAPCYIDLIREIEACATRLGINPQTVPKRAVGNSQLYKTLIAGGGCSHETACRLREFIHSHTPSTAPLTEAD